MLRFHEKLPGVLGSIVILSLFLTASVFVLGSIRELHDTGGAVNVVALMAGLPGAAVLAAGGRLGLSHPNVSLATRAGLVATVVLSGVGVMLYAAQVSGMLVLDCGISMFGSKFPITSPPWLARFAACAWLTMFLALTYLNRARAYYGRLWSRKSPRRGDAVPHIPGRSDAPLEGDRSGADPAKLR